MIWGGGEDAWYGMQKESSGTGFCGWVGAETHASNVGEGQFCYEPCFSALACTPAFLSLYHPQGGEGATCWTKTEVVAVYWRGKGYKCGGQEGGGEWEGRYGRKGGVVIAFHDMP